MMGVGVRVGVAVGAGVQGTGVEVAWGITVGASCTMATAVGVGEVISRPHPESNGPAMKIDRMRKERDLIFSSRDGMRLS
jgi:hypothetical protein